jgi:hypothetical protein
MREFRRRASAQAKKDKRKPTVSDPVPGLFD